MNPDLARRIAALRICDDAPPLFWGRYLEALVELAAAESAHLYRLAPSADDPAGPVAWRRLAAIPARAPAPGGAESALAAAPATGHALAELPGGRLALLLRLQTGEGEAAPLVFLPIGVVPRAVAEEAAGHLALVADTPALYLRHRARGEARRETEVFASALDLLSLLDRETRFAAAALLVCSELAPRLHADRVSLGWLSAGQIVKIVALGGADKIERRTEAVRALELAHEECLDQDEGILHPPPDGTGAITRDHAAYAALVSATALLSAPLRLEGEPVAVLLAERSSGEFDEAAIHTLRVHADRLARRLGDLRERDRPWPARAASRVRKWGEIWAGPRYTTAKLCAVLGALVLLFLVLGRWPHRVKAPFLLRSDQVVYVTAPFDGYLAEAPAAPGDVLAADAVLARFDTRELLLEEAAALADQTRHLREAERARSRNELAELRIAEAQAAQSAARLGQIRHRLGLATLTPGFAATLAEGDQRRRLGAPVRTGDVLYQVARLDALSFEVQVDERDIHHVVVGARARAAFEGRPSETFDLVVERIEPSARPTPTGNVFHVRATLAGAPADWWRPGMGGVVRVHAGWRTPLWLLTRRTLDYLRLHWWFW